MSFNLNIFTSSGKSDFTRNLVLEFDGDFESFYSTVSKQLNNYLRTDLTTAQKFIKVTTNLLPYFPDNQKYRGYALQARYYLWAGEYKKSMTGYQKALDLTIKSRNGRASALIRKALVEVAMYSGKYDQALVFGQSAARYFKRIGDLNNYAQTVTNIGNVYHRMDRNKQALAQYEKAAKIFDKDGGIPSAIVSFNKANIYTNLNQIRQAEELYKKAAGIYSSAHLTLAHQQVIYSLAYLYFLDSRISEALTLFDKVYDSFRDLGDTKAAVITLLDIIELNVEINQFGSAVMLGETVIPELRRLRMVYEEAKANYFIARARMELGDLTSSGKLLRRAEYLFTKENNMLWIGMALVLRAELSMGKHQYTEAIRFAREAAGKFKKSGDARRKVDADLVEHKALLLSHKGKKADNLASRIRKQPLTLSQICLLEETIGSYQYEKKKYGQAITHFEKSINAVETLLETFEPDEIRFFFALNKYSIYAKYISALVHQGKIKRSFLANLNALQLLLQKQFTEKNIRKELSAHDTRKLIELRTRLHKVYGTPRGSRQITPQQENARQIEHQIWQLQKKRSYATVSKTNRLTSDKLQLLPVLKSHELIINYVLVDSEILAFVNSADTVRVTHLPVPVNELHRLIRKLHFLAEQSSAGSTVTQAEHQAVQIYLKELYEYLIAPLEVTRNIKSLHILPDSLLQQVPFYALTDSDGCTLIDTYEVHLPLLPDTFYKNKSSKLNPDKKRNGLLAAHSSQLPMIEEECWAIESLFPEVNKGCGQEATVDKLVELGEKVTGFLHIAAHASRSSENPIFSRILLSDGAFFPFDLHQVQINAKLVALSGCQTAAPGLNYGNSFSLARAFSQAGAEFIVASLWPVNDTMTMIFMKQLYAALTETHDIRQSFTAAVTYMKEKTDDPIVWNAFVLLE